MKTVRQIFYRNFINSKTGTFHEWARALLALALLLPVLFISLQSYSSLKQAWTQSILYRRQVQTHTAALTLRERFDRILDIGVAYANRVQFRKLIKEGRWEDAIQILEKVPERHPFFDRVFLTDPAGTETADAPHRPGAVGVNFAHRDWYQGVSREWKPYLSEVYRRMAEPAYNVVSAAIPVKSDEGGLLGILVLQVKLNIFAEWLREFGDSSGGYFFITDFKGQIAAHPRHPPQEEIVSYLQALPVVRGLREKMGVAGYADPASGEEKVAAFDTVPRFGWIVVWEEPAWAAFARRDQQLRQLGTGYGMLLVLMLLVVLSILKGMNLVALQRHQEKTLLQSIGDGVFAIDRNFNVILWNEACTRVSGWTAEDVMGKRFTDYVRFFSLKDHVENIAFIMRAMATGESQRVEEDMVVLSKDGRRIPIADSAAPVFDANGRVSGAIIVFRDIIERVRLEEERKRAFEELESRVQERTHELSQMNEELKIEMERRGRIEKALTQSEKRYESMIEAAPDPIVTLTLNGIVNYMNPMAEEISGFSREEIVGRHFVDLDILTPGSVSRALTEFAYVARGDKREPFEIEILAKGGKHLNFEVHAYLVQTDREGVIQAIFRDLTARRHLESQLLQTQKMESLGEFTGGISHDFNNTLSVIKGFAEMRMMSLEEKDPIREDLQQILGAARKAQALIRQLLFFSRRNVVKPVVFDLGEVVSASLGMLRRVIPEKVLIEEQMAPEKLFVKTDPNLLDQVLTNLTLNAVDAVSEHGKIIFQTKSVLIKEGDPPLPPSLKPGAYAVLTVRDNGTGISEEIRSRIFEPFFTTKPAGKGTGLGLATSYGIVTQAGGAIDVESEPGKGSAFHVYLPRTSEEPSAAAAPSGKEGRIPRGSETILIVEDDDALRRWLVQFLSQLGYRVLEAVDGQAALDHYRGNLTKDIDLVLTDVVMPRMNGRQFVQEARKINPSLKVIFASGYVEEEAEMGLLRDLGEAFIAKPFSVLDLGVQVRQVLDLPPKDHSH